MIAAFADDELDQAAPLVDLAPRLPLQLTADRQYIALRELRPSEIIEAAQRIANSACHRGGPPIRDVCDLAPLIVLETAGDVCERAGAAFLDSAGRLLALETLTRGSVRSVKNPLGEICRRAIAHGSSAAILWHSHPSPGCFTPSDADLWLYPHAVDFCARADVVVLDEVIVDAAGTATSVKAWIAEHPETDPPPKPDRPWRDCAAALREACFHMRRALAALIDPL